jgi:hypothetical protein
MEDGIIGGIIKSGSGSAIMYAQDSGGGDAFTYYDDLLYKIEIDSVAGGKEISQATFKWIVYGRGGSASWTTGVATSTALTSLSNGVHVKWVAGTGNDFELGDTFTVFTKSSFSPLKTTDTRRDTLFKGKAGTTTKFCWNLGSSRNVKVISLLDVTTTGGDVITSVTVKGGDVPYPFPVWEYTTTMTVTSPHIILFLDETYQYWEFTIATSSSVNVIIGQMFIGDYVDFPAGAMYTPGSSERLVSDIPDSALFDYPRRISANRREFTFKWQNIHADYRALFDDLFAATRQNADGMERPVFVHLDPTDDGETLYWTKLVSNLDREWTTYQRDSLTLDFREVAANYAL